MSNINYMTTKKLIKIIMDTSLFSLIRKNPPWRTTRSITGGVVGRNRERVHSFGRQNVSSDAQSRARPVLEHQLGAQ